jgi:hypothetical protein
MKLSQAQKLVILPLENKLDHLLVNISNQEMNQLVRNNILIRDDDGKITVNNKQLNKLFDESFVITYRNLFRNIRNGSKGNKQATIRKLRKLFNDNDITKKEVLDLATLHVRNKGKLARNADYFLYKEITENGMKFTISPILELWEEVKDDIKINQTFTKSI